VYGSNVDENEDQGEEHIEKDLTHITIDQGIFQGKEDIAINGKKFYSFTGIPYAKPPIDSLRFKVKKIMTLDIVNL